MSSAPTLIFTAHRPTSVEKVLKKDDNGYYRVTLGALNCHNSSGEYYVAQGVKELMEDESSLVNKRLKSGYLVGEMGHPQFQPGMTKADYIARLFKIPQENTSHHIKSVEFAPGPNGMVKMVGWVKPTGPKGDLLKASLDNPDQNTAFSIRSITTDYVDRGKTIKKIVQIITWDWVEFPGINVANKWDTLGMESIDVVKFNVNDLVSVSKILKQEMVGVENEGILPTIQKITKDVGYTVNCNDFLNKW